MKKGNNNVRLRNVSIWMERFWLLLTVVSLIIVIYLMFTEENKKQTLQFLVFPGLAGLMYGFRYTFRKRMEGREQQ